MAWTTPKTWTVDELVTASMLNTHLRDNLNYLFSGRGGGGTAVLRDNSGQYTTTSTSFVDVDATNLKIDLTLSGTKVLVGFSGVVEHSLGNNRVFFDVDVGGTRHANSFTDGLVMWRGENGPATMGAAFVVLITGLSTGANTFKLQWKVASGTGRLKSNSTDSPVNFWAMEVG